MAKMTIYLSDDLKSRMDGAEVERGTWSALASQAFEGKLAEIIGRKGVKDMNDVIMRLRASKHEAMSEAKAVGHAAGVEWAKNCATYPELVRLAEVALDEDAWQDEMYTTSKDDEDYDGTTEAETFGYIVLALKGHDTATRCRALDFWAKAAPIQTEAQFSFVPDRAFIDGFAEGAMEVWKTIKINL